MLEHNYLFNRISITSIDNNKLVGFVISITPGLSQFVNVYIAIYVYQLDISWLDFAINKLVFVE